MPPILPGWRTALIAAAAAGATIMAVHGALGVPLDVTRLRADREGSVPTWFSSTQFAVAALACAAVRRRAWLAVALLLTAFSVDEAVTGHEATGRAVGYDVSQQLLQPVAAVVVGAFLLLVARREGSVPRRLLRGAAAALVASQTAATLGGALEGDGALVHLLTFFEEWLELLVGTLLLAAGLAATQLSGRNADARHSARAARPSAAD